MYEVKNEILKEYSTEELSNTYSSQLNKAKEILKTKMKYYNSHPITTSDGKLIDTLNFTKDAVMDNVETLLDRNDKIDMIINNSDKLKDSSYMISNLAQNLDNKESIRKNRYIVSLVLRGTLILEWGF